MTKHGEGMEVRLREFFRANPREELTFADARIKFGCTQRQLIAAVYSLRQSGHIKTAHIIRASNGE